jgi:hypothetical protein
MYKLPNWFNVIPVQDKRPLVKWEQYIDRKQTLEEKAELMKLNPNGKVGVICGPVSQLFVLDDDGGFDEKKYSVPKTRTVKTPRGGKHYYFRWIPQLDGKITTCTGILPGVDVRGQGGFVVHYEWEKHSSLYQFAEPPQWLIDLLPDKGTHSTSMVAQTKQKADDPWIKQQFDEMKEGNRNATFTSIAGSLRSRGYSPDEIFVLLQGKAKEVDFSDHELRTICASIGRYEPRGAVSGNASSIESLLEDDSLEAFLQEVKPRQWVIPGLIAKESITFLAGLPKCYKSWLLIDLALEASKNDGKWLNKFPVNKCKVLYIDQERSKEESQRRFLSLMSEKNISYKDLSLRVKTKTRIKIDLDASFEAFKRELKEKQPDLVLVDSFIRFHTKNVMDQSAIQPVLERLTELRNEFKCSFVFIYHDRKTTYNTETKQPPSFEDMVGSIFISSVADHCFSVRKQDAETSLVYNTANNLGATVDPFMVRVIDRDEEKTKISVEAF